MDINVADAIKISSNKITTYYYDDIIEIKDDQDNVLWKYVEQVPQNQNLIFETRGNKYIAEQGTYTAFPTYYVDVTKKNVFYKYMSYNGVLSSTSDESNIWFDGVDIYCGNWKLDRTNNTWVKQNWSDPSVIRSYYMYAYDGTIYMSGSQWQDAYRFNRATNTWIKTSKFGTVEGYDVWTDGTELYYSHGSIQWVYDADNSEWKNKTWPFTFNGRNVIKIDNVFYIKTTYGSFYTWDGYNNYNKITES